MWSALLLLPLLWARTSAQKPHLNKTLYSHHRIIDFALYNPLMEDSNMFALSFLEQHGLMLPASAESYVDMSGGALWLFQPWNDKRKEQREAQIVLTEELSDVHVVTTIRGDLSSCNVQDQKLQVQHTSNPLAVRKRSRSKRASFKPRKATTSTFTLLRTKTQETIYINDFYHGHSLNPHTYVPILKWSPCEGQTITKISKIEIYHNLAEEIKSLPTVVGIEDAEGRESWSRLMRKAFHLTSEGH